VMDDLYTWQSTPARWDLINHCIDKFGYKRYLEIGCAHDQCFNNVRCDVKVGVDPARGGTHRMTSDAYFAQCDEEFDIVFIDGLHIRDQVMRDVENSLMHLSHDGTIVIHDCIPVNEIQQRVPNERGGPWTGDVWRAALELRRRDDIDMAVGLFDAGVGVIKVRKNTNKPQFDVDPLLMSWDEFKKMHVELLNTMHFKLLLEWLEK
jgi:hypothetical protein